MQTFLRTLDDEMRHQFQVLLDYVYSEFAEEYKIVDDMTENGKIFTHTLGIFSNQAKLWSRAMTRTREVT